MARCPHRNAMGKTMRTFGRVGVIVVLAVLADGTAVLAQANAYNRLTNGRQDPTPFSSKGISVARSGASTAVARTVRQTDERLPYQAQQGIGVARSGTNTTVARTVYETDELHPYTAEYRAQAQAPRSEIPAGSTWEQQPRQPVSSPQPQVVVRSQPHNYYPNMRTGMTPQQPVTLTASRTSYYPGCHCTPSRSQALGGGGHHR
jgi:hypothetical protein